jgi:alpha-tubulin suppressor-like RCC1 family protein
MKSLKLTVLLLGLTVMGCSSEDAATHAPLSQNPAVTADHFKIMMGHETVYAIKPDGSLWACGHMGLRYYVVQIGSDSNWESVTNTKAIKTDGTLWNLDGNWPMNSDVPIFAVTQIGSANDWKEVISWGETAFYAIKDNGTLWAQGYVSYMYGSGHLDELTQLGTDSWKQIAIGNDYTLGLKTDGTLWTWGYCTEGQMGLGEMVSGVGLTQIGTATDWNFVTSGGFNSYAIKQNGTLWSWGGNFEGVLGLGNDTNVAVPTQIGGDANWKFVSATGESASGVKTDGTLWGWGNYLIYNVGTWIDNLEQRRSPSKISNDTDWDTTSMGSGMFFRKTNGEYWGRGMSYYLGVPDDNLLKELTPVIWQ